MFIRKSFELYRDQFGKIFLLGLLVILPVQWLCLFIDNYFYAYYGLFGLTYVADFFYGINMLLALSFVQIPFIKMLSCYVKGEPIYFSQVYGSVWENGFVVFVMGILYSIGVGTGTLLLIIPGIILMVLLYSFPYVVVLERKRWGKAFKQAYQFGKSNFFKLLGIIFGFSLIEWIIEWGVEGLTLLFTNRYLIISLVLMLANMLFVPLFAFINASFYLKWKERSSFMN
jgi:hypothetical protein